MNQTQNQNGVASLNVEKAIIDTEFDFFVGEVDHEKKIIKRISESFFQVEPGFEDSQYIADNENAGKTERQVSEENGEEWEDTYWDGKTFIETGTYYASDEVNPKMIKISDEEQKLIDSCKKEYVLTDGELSDYEVVI